MQEVWPALKESEYRELEVSILNQGQLEDIYLGFVEGVGLFVLDGHHRMEILTRHDITPTFRRPPIVFEDMEDALGWARKHQRGRRNATDYALGESVLKDKERVQAEALLRQEATHINNQGTTVRENFPSPEGRTRDVLGETIGISGKTLEKIEYISKHADEKTKTALRKGTSRGKKKLSIDSVYNDLKAREMAMQRKAARLR
jgi:hypothetical protein